MSNPEETKRIAEAAAREAAKAAVHETLVALGIDVSDPFEIQKDMAAMRDMRHLLSDEEFQKDLAQIRALRTSGKFIRTAAGKAIVTVIVTGLLGLLWLGVQGYFGFGDNP